jgi:hypothetical protein
MGTPGSGPSLTNSLLNQPMNPPPLAGQPAHWETNSVDAAPMGAQQIPALPGDDALLNYGVPGFSNVSESTPWSIEIDARPTEPYEDGSRKHGISASGDDNNNNCDNRDTN